MSRPTPNVLFRVVGHDEWKDWKRTGRLRCVGTASYEFGKCCWENLDDAMRWSVAAGAADFYEPPVHLLRIALPAEREGGMTFLGPNLDQIGPAWVLHNELLDSVQVEETGDAT